MGGFGSGRWKSSGRNTVETCRSLDVDGLSMTGCLRPGRRSSCQWSNGEKVASISLRAEADGLHLSYRVRIGGGDWEDVAETIRIVRVPCRFGGSRAYFMCPGNGNGVECGRRVAKLHQLTRYFLCRHCNRLMYTSQSESQWERAIRRANKMNQRLGNDAGMFAPLPERRKGMWLRTYRSLLDKTLEAEMLAHKACLNSGPTLVGTDREN